MKTPGFARNPSLTATNQPGTSNITMEQQQQADTAMFGPNLSRPLPLTFANNL